ncbi:DoxX family protein [Mycobacterium sp. 141]|uniref:DoxX family protein n=1 Tax=Mycobacterium sp. 141 TaxID=1120797 RepID=UPI000477BFD2|nr:DoxX family protein [Mycobacterium sp. 141]
MTTTVDRLAQWAIAAYRIAIGLLFFFHGVSTLFAWPVEPHGGSTPGFMASPSWWAAMIQLVGGGLIMAGLFTRSAAFLSSGSMAVAYFWRHQGDGLWPIENDGELSALFCWALFILVFIGPGKLAVESLIRRWLARGADAAVRESVVPEAARS